MNRLFWQCCCAAVLTLFAVLPALAIDKPPVLDPAWEMQQIAAEPALVTPTGCCFDDQGRLLVIECHTHFPPEDYQGAKNDRIYLFDDSDQDGVLDRQRLFYEGGVATMNIVNLGDGWFAVATRSEVVRIRDSDGDDGADQREVLLSHQTGATYPHNGLGGLALGNDGWLYVGQGENLGEGYRLIGTDGSAQTGGGEGGNVFRCRPDGSQVQRVATGLWNPFGLCFDHANRLWAVGNDPDSMPPNRLLHVVLGGDYGFQFRFGRAGIHPLQAWDGELPGTLPMVMGTGEAACAVTTLGKHLWVTSWGDNRIERHTPVARGASWASEREVIVQGDANFRPVGLATAADGSIYITDWVDRSYPVHGKGRLWRLSHKQTGQTASREDVPNLTAAEQQAADLRTGEELTADQRLSALESDDPFIHQAAAIGLLQRDQLTAIDVEHPLSAAQAVGVLSAWRWSELVDPNSLSAEQRRKWLEWGLAHESDDVLLAAIRWATERSCQDQLPTIRGLLDRQGISTQLFTAIIASIAFLETGSAAGGKRDPAIEKLLVEFAGNAERAVELRAIAIRRIPSEAESPTDDQLSDWIANQPSRALGREVVRLLAARDKATATEQLAKITVNATLDVQTRADALAALARVAGQYSPLINKFSLPAADEVLQTEARRMRNRTWKPDQPLPDKENLPAWVMLVGEQGDSEAGRRVFFRTTCANCHMYDGRGAKTGPDLTTLSGSMTRARILESILHPSKEVGPLYVPWRVLTVDGAVLTGLKLDAAGVGGGIRFQGADGNMFDITLENIETQEPIAQSIMPAGLEETMTLDELRDLIAFLAGTP